MWKRLGKDGYVARVLVNVFRWINSFTIFTIYRTTKDLYKSRCSCACVEKEKKENKNKTKKKKKKKNVSYSLHIFPSHHQTQYISEKPKWIIWLIWAIVGQFTDKMTQKCVKNEFFLSV